MHEGHRDRVRKRFREEGLDHFSDVQALELLLFYVIPRGDTNPIAHELLSHFGSISQVLEAPVEELKRIPGMGESSAAFLRLITETGRYYMVHRSTQSSVLPTLEQCAEYMVPFFFGRRLETVFLLCLDAKKSVISCINLGSGVVNAVDVNVRKVVENAVRHRANTVILAHNHPGGVALPSREDERLTIEIAAALKLVGIPLVDHIIVAGDDYVSFADSGMMSLSNG